MAMKNRMKRVTPFWEIKSTGNWNHKHPDKLAICTKPMGVVNLDGDEYVFTHDDLFTLLDTYLSADKVSIAMIKNKDINTGEISMFESPFEEKIKKWLKRKGVVLAQETKGFNPNEWAKDSCETCGGHLFCKKCNKFTWHKGGEDNGQKK